jgi:hypothetical protein
MYNVMIKLIVAAAILELGLSLKHADQCASRACWDKLQTASKQVLKIDWKPISVFPEEAKRFNKTLR